MKEEEKNNIETMERGEEEGVGLAMTRGIDKEARSFSAVDARPSLEREREREVMKRDTTVTMQQCTSHELDVTVTVMLGTHYRSGVRVSVSRSKVTVDQRMRKNAKTAEQKSERWAR